MAIVLLVVLVLGVTFIFEEEEDERAVWNFRTRSEKHPVEPSYSLLASVARATLLG
ncbi:MAG: hypothetical protein HY674_02135 [Chloroflexi bacterium]|nr:hypothetical protein [Chloroflexota bacterium]